MTLYWEVKVNVQCLYSKTQTFCRQNSSVNIFIFPSEARAEKLYLQWKSNVRGNYNVFFWCFSIKNTSYHHKELLLYLAALYVAHNKWTGISTQPAGKDTAGIFQENLTTHQGWESSQDIGDNSLTVVMSAKKVRTSCTAVSPQTWGTGVSLY